MIVKVHLGIGYVTASRDDELEIDDSELEGMTPEEIETYVDEYVWEWAYSYIDVGWKIDE